MQLMDNRLACEGVIVWKAKLRRDESSGQERKKSIWYTRDMTELKTYTGRCHCGNVRYEVEADLSIVIECNCSHCQIKGLLLVFTPAEKFKLLSGEDSLIDYRFNTHVINHRFCSDCGVESFADGEKDGAKMVAINARCLDEVDITKLNRIPFEGRKL
jgi:hypothetical protein